MKHAQMIDFQQNAELAGNGSFDAGQLTNGWWILPFAGLGLISWYWLITGFLSFFN